jgi:hypothetical protein
MGLFLIRNPNLKNIKKSSSFALDRKKVLNFSDDQRFPLISRPLVIGLNWPNFAL